MRLLHSQADEQGLFSLADFERGKIPKYAILSHTWLEAGQEVTFEDVSQRAGQEKEGYDKLRFCAERAKDASLDYFWVDTCCIKKSDSAELSEAINTIFEWYSRSEVCYALLTDVNTSTSDIDDGNSTWLSQFKKSRWHRRGWTLQELVAPAGVEFWSRQWIKLGDKRSLEQEIHDTTGVPLQALRGTPLRSFSVEERHGWMRNRQTKLEEDQAYCLLGIFNVSIPVIYGERRDRAIDRLNDEIARTFRNDLQKVQVVIHDQASADSPKLDVQTSSPLPASQSVHRTRLLESLKLDTFDVRRLGTATAQSGTCRWLMDHLIYKSWEDKSKCQEHHGFLWIKGKPGAGKSTMMKYIHGQTEKNKMPTDIIISFFFHARGAQSEKSTLGMWTALLYQLLTAAPDLQLVLDKAWFPSTYDATNPPWTVEILSTLFQAAIEQLKNRHLKCFIDALDECAEEEVRIMVDTLEQIGEHALEVNQQLQVCFTSRHYPHISLQFGEEIILEAEPGHSEDLSKYIQQQLRAHKSTGADKIKKQIQENANGVFMWAVIVVSMLKPELDKGRVHTVQQKLTGLPRKLSDLFRDMLGRDKDNLDETLLCYQWILFAARPLTKEEFYYAVLAGDQHASDDIRFAPWDPEEVTEEDMKHFISSTSKGLAELTQSKPTVQFIHESVRDFLLKDGGLRELTGQLGERLESVSHDRLRQCCQSYLRVDRTMVTPEKPTDGDRDAFRRLYPFLEYAGKHVLTHANNAAADMSPQEFLEAFSLDLWIRTNNLFETVESYRHSKDASLLYILAENGCNYLIRYLCQDGPIIGERGERFHFPLFAALANGHYDAGRAILLSGQKQPKADVKFSGNGKPGALHPVFWALTESLDTIAELILESKDLEWENIETYEGRQLLHFAVEKGCQSATRLLIGMDRFAGTINMQSAFSAPTSVEKRHDKLFTSNFLTTPLGYAAASGDEAMIQILIDGGAEIVPTVPIRRSPLGCAIVYGTTDVVSLLFEKADISVDQVVGSHRLSFFQGTPLFVAAFYGRLDMVQWLLTRGANVHLGHEDGRSPLHAASERGHEDVAKLLLGHGGSLAAFDKQGNSALHLAAIYGNANIVEVWLSQTIEHSTDPVPDLQNLDLSAAVEDCSEIPDTATRSGASDTLGAVSPSVKVEAEPSKPTDHKARNPLTEARDNQGRTPLMRAAMASNNSCMHILFLRGAHVDARDYSGKTVLMHAVGYRDDEVNAAYRPEAVNALLGYGAGTEARDFQGMTALLHAAQDHKAKAVDRLLQGGGSTKVTTPEGQTVRDLYPGYDWDRAA